MVCARKDAGADRPQRRAAPRQAAKAQFGHSAVKDCSEGETSACFNNWCKTASSRTLLTRSTNDPGTSPNRSANTSMTASCRTLLQPLPPPFLPPFRASLPSALLHPSSRPNRSMLVKGGIVFSRSKVINSSRNSISNACGNANSQSIRPEQRHDLLPPVTPLIQPPRQLPLQRLARRHVPARGLRGQVRRNHRGGRISIPLQLCPPEIQQLADRILKPHSATPQLFFVGTGTPPRPGVGQDHQGRHRLPEPETSQPLRPGRQTVPFRHNLAAVAQQQLAAGARRFLSRCMTAELTPSTQQGSNTCHPP
jgi:hypothetical protein